LTGLNEIIGAICLSIMKRTDPEWTKKEAEKLGLTEDDY